ncbi:uncharacterized protein LOC127750813 [Frankliniella occidentalis]|uniref:Uncharacterized protein LOC127750813 n=1 Tax=Frankliniella occidentalis TaxID=133901 RepID=A0A9C6XSC6_FRAOC|nr:uncharacterized protein LOC127750813 [Frankliniella occidentalis]
MLLNAVLVAALLLAAAACPCPPAPADSEVCGSDLVTYASLCHLLQCAAVPGLSLEHPGPCSAENAVSADQPSGSRAHHRSRRSATEETQRLDECEEERQCGNATCSECVAGDADCANMCERNCRCGCAGYPPGSLMDDNLRTAIEEEMQCWSTRMGCTGFLCGFFQSCVDRCNLDYRKCLCESVQRAGNRSSAATSTTTTTTTTSTTTNDTSTTTADDTSTTTTSSPTSSSSSTTSTEEPALPCVPVVLEYVLVFASACVCVSASVWVLARACRSCLVSPPEPARGVAELAPVRQPRMGSENKLYVYLVQPRIENENKLHI